MKSVHMRYRKCDVTIRLFFSPGSFAKTLSDPSPGLVFLLPLISYIILNIYEYNSSNLIFNCTLYFSRLLTVFYKK